jgi:hypothetical protein
MTRLDRTKLLALRNNIQNYLDKVERDDRVLNLDKTINANTTELVNGLYDGLVRKLDARQDASLETDKLIAALRELRTPPPKDRTDEVVTAISGLRFPEINFPNSISVDNFPPQKIPNPVTNVKATIVGDTTGLLGGTGGEIVQSFSVNASVAAGNTVVLATLTAPIGKKIELSGVYGEGVDNGIFSLYINSLKQWQARNAWTDRNVQSYLQYLVNTGLTAQLKVTNIMNATRAYSGGIYGRQINA